MRDANCSQEYRYNEESCDDQCEQQTTVSTTDQEEGHKWSLINTIAEAGTRLPWQERSKLQALLCKHHSVFSLEDEERGETAMV